MYEVGDKVVYPHHGAGTVVKKEKREVLGEAREYLTIKILHNDMTVQVPSENAEKVGLRRVIGEKEVGVVLKALTGVSTEMPKNWNRRFKHNRDKMKTGDILELAEVVRNLALRDREKGLSTGEKQMFVKAKKILASELMYAKDMDEDECAEWLEEVLASDGTTARRSRRRRRRPPRPPPPSRSSAMSVWAILVAAGRGERLGLDQPKAFAKLGEDPLLAEPLRRLEECAWVDAIVLVAPPGWEEPAILLAEELGCGKVHACVAGGETRSGSVRAGLEEVAADALVVLVHDAARPLLEDAVVDARSRAAVGGLGRGRARAAGCGHAQARRRGRRHRARRCRATGSGRCRRRRRSSPTRSAAPTRAASTRPTAPRSWRPRAAASPSSTAIRACSR